MGPRQLPTIEEVRLQELAKFAGYGLTTLDILYRLPDYPDIMQEFIWQLNDVHPKFPRSHEFVRFWRLKIEGPLVQVRITHLIQFSAHEVRAIKTELRIH